MYHLYLTICKPGSATDPSRTAFTAQQLQTIRDKVAAFFSNRSISVSLISSEIRNKNIEAVIEAPETDEWFQDAISALADQNNYRGTLRVIWPDGNNFVIAEGAFTPKGIRGKKYSKPTLGTSFEMER